MAILRDLPSVDELLRTFTTYDVLPLEVVKSEIRSVLAERRKQLLQGDKSNGIAIEEQVKQRLSSLATLSLRRVINATGVVLHTNLGRAPLPEFQPSVGYSNLEYDLVAGRRGRRDDHLAPLLESLLGRPAIAVNNNAAAVFLVLHELAAGHEVIVSRGELIEIGDGFRIPDIMSRSGAILREVGTTNRTKLQDYSDAICDKTRLILRVHPSNFHVTGFSARPSLKELTTLAATRKLPVYEDLGSGCLLDLKIGGIEEPLVTDSLRAGVNLVSFSGDKLLGGPQAGIIAGDAQLVHRVRRNPLYRTFRLDKLVTQALQVTLHHLLRHEWDKVPAYRMILSPIADIRARAENVSRRCGRFCQARESRSVIGGGSTPDQSLPTWVVEVTVPKPSALEERLRQADVPVIARIEKDRLILDMRTVSDEEESLLVSSLLGALA